MGSFTLGGISLLTLVCNLAVFSVFHEYVTDALNKLQWIVGNVLHQCFKFSHTVRHCHRTLATAQNSDITYCHQLQYDYPSYSHSTTQTKLQTWSLQIGLTSRRGLLTWRFFWVPKSVTLWEPHSKTHQRVNSSLSHAIGAAHSINWPEFKLAVFWVAVATQHKPSA